MLRNRVIWPNCYEHTVVVASWTLQDVKEEPSFTAARRWCAFQGSHCRFPKFIGKKRLRDRMRALGTVLKVPACRVQVLTLCFRRSENRGLHKSGYIDLVGIEVMPDDLPEPPAGNRRRRGAQQGYRSQSRCRPQLESEVRTTTHQSPHCSAFLCSREESPPPPTRDRGSSSPHRDIQTRDIQKGT
jgi:hypothetical protein